MVFWLASILAYFPFVMKILGAVPSLVSSSETHVTHTGNLWFAIIDAGFYGSLCLFFPARIEFN